MSHVEVILKVAERCNLNCKYCYFFNKENKDFENHPALISMDTIHQLVKFLRTSPQEMSETIFQIDIHGGEPLLLGPRRFSEMVSIIRNGLHDAKEINFTVQTNAVLINQAWLDVFSRDQIYVGISVDGPKAQHDLNRIDRRGRGTFDNMKPKIAAVKQRVVDGRLPGFGSICVVSPDSDARATYQCLTQELGFSRLQFLFPDDTHDSVNFGEVKRFANFAADLFDCWAGDTNRNIRIGHIDRTFQAILQDDVNIAGGRLTPTIPDGIAFTVSSGGDLGHDDTLRNVVPHLFDFGMNVAEATFPDFLAWHNRVTDILIPGRRAPACASCAWDHICESVTSFDSPLYRMKGGVADQPSIYCEALKTIYLKSAAYLSKRGVPIQKISKNIMVERPVTLQ